MTGKDYLLAGLLGGAYVLLFSYLIGHTFTWGDPTSWYEFWGRNNAAALSWMQIFHSVGVVLVAVPVAATIVWRYQSDWLRPTLIVAIVGSSYMLFDQVRGTWILTDFDVQPGAWYLVSGAIDILKVGLIFHLVATSLRWLIPLRKTPI